MRVTRSFTPAPESCGFRTAATLGTFDGVHQGHRKLLGRLVEVAREAGIESAIMTFDEHPLTVIRPDKAPGILTSLDEKLAQFEALGIDRVFVLEFTDEIAGMDSGTFIERYLVHCLGILYFIVGYDHHFGSDRLRSKDRLGQLAETYDFTVEVVPPVHIDGQVVKSSGIRELIESGGVAQAARHLGEAYSLAGTVTHGRGMGRKLGFPTANIAPLDSQKVVPGDGVYVGWTELDGQRYDAVMTVGPIPTFGLSERFIEAHLPGFNRDIYDRPIRVGFTSRLRDIMTFDSETALIRQIEADIREAYHIIQK